MAMAFDSEAKLAWKKKNTRNLVVNINRNQDAEIFAWLETLNGKPFGAPIKAAIKEYIHNHDLLPTEEDIAPPWESEET